MALRFFVGDGGGNLWSGDCWANVSGGAPDGGGPPGAGDDTAFDAVSPSCNLDVNTPVLNSLDFASWPAGGYTGTFSQGGFTISVGTYLYLSGFMVLNHGGGEMLMTGTGDLLSFGITIGALRIDDGGGGGSVEQHDNLNVAGNVTFTSGAYTTTDAFFPHSLTVGGTVFFACNDTVALDLLTCAALDCTGGTGTLTQNATWTITGTVFTLDGGMTFTQNNNLLDFTAVAGNVLLTTDGVAIYSARFGNAGAGAVFQQQDALTATRDFTVIDGDYDSNGFALVVGRNAIVSGVGDCDFGVFSCDSLNFTGATGTVTQSGTWTITSAVGGTGLVMGAGMTFVHGLNLIDFVSVVVSPNITTNAITLGSVRVGNAGAGAVFNQTDALDLAGNLTCVDGDFVASAATTVTGTIFMTGAGSVTLVGATCGRLDATGCTGDLTLGGTLTITGTVFKLDPGMSGFLHGNQLIDFVAVAGTTDISTAGFGLWSVRFGNAGAGGTYRQLDDFGTFDDATFVHGIYNSNAHAMSIGGDVVATTDGTCTFGLLACQKLDCTGCTGTLVQTNTWSIASTVFTLVAGMVFTHNNQLIDFVAVAGDVLITSGGQTLGSVRFGHSGAGGTYRPQDNMTLANNFTAQRGDFDAGMFDLSVAGTIYMNGTGSATFRVTSAANLDCTGCTGTLTLTPGGVTISGTVFKLAAAMAVVHNSQVVAFTAVAGVVLITSAGQTLHCFTIGSAGAGGTYRQQDALTLSDGIDCWNGVWQTNNHNLTLLGGDLQWQATMLANGFVSGTATVSVGRRLIIISLAAVHSCGTSSWRFTGTGAIMLPAGAANLEFYNLYVADPGQVTSLVMGAGTNIVVHRQLTTGSGAFSKADATSGQTLLFEAGLSGVADQFRPDPGVGVTMQGIDWVFECGGGVAPVTVELWPCGLFALTAVAGVGGALQFATRTLTQNVVVRARNNCVYTCANGFGFSVLDAAATGAMSKQLDLNGFSVSFLGGTTTNGFNAANGRAWWFNFPAASAFVCAAYSEYCPNQPANMTHAMAANTAFQVAGNYSYVGGALLPRRFSMAADTSRLVVGGNYSGANMNTWVGQNVGTVQFTAAGAFTITQNIQDTWPKILISGGGTVTLPNLFNCYDLTIAAGLVTAGAVLVVRNSLANAGTFTGSANMYVGSGFINTGTFVGAGTNVICQGPVCSLSGFNGNNVTMDKTCGRLQFLTSMNITGALVILPRTQPPGVMVFLGGGVFAIANFNSLVTCTDDLVQVVSSVPGTQYTLNVAVLTSAANCWFRDCIWVGPPLVGNLTNRDLRNNVGMTLNFPPAYVRVISEDAGSDLLAANALDSIQYCWLVATSQAALAALAAAFLAGTNNWHRRTAVPLAFLDNLVLGTNYWIGLGLRDDRNNRVAPNIGAGDFATAVALTPESGGGGASRITVTTKIPSVS